jgi:acetoin utilization protein AcuB
MIVSDVMTTKLITVTPDDTLSHVASLLRQHQFHHLPVVQASGTPGSWKTEQGTGSVRPILEGLITAQDIEMAVAADASSDSDTRQPWQERHVAEIMHRDIMRVSPTTSVAAAAQIMVDRSLNCLPVTEYASVVQQKPNSNDQGTEAVLVGLLTRSDLLLAFARSMGAFAPGMDLVLPLPAGDLTPLGKALLLAAELHIPVRSILAAPTEGNVPHVVTVRLATMYPTPLLVRLQQAQIQYSFADHSSGGVSHG